MPKSATPSQQPVHLSAQERILQGSFYTPAKYVQLVGEWLREHSLAKNCVVLDPSCGYGAFFALTDLFPQNLFIGNDIDQAAVSQATADFPHVKFFCQNALCNVRREMYGIVDDAKLIVVGNPPYNDTTSQYQGKLKQTTKPLMDADVKSRDLGLSSLLAYSKLKADYVAVLHPLAYLIKRANFKAAFPFFANYRLLHHVVFSSQEFAGTSKTAGFPVIVGFYERHPNHGLSYDGVRQMNFTTVEGKSFSLGQFRYVSEFVRKYPSRSCAPTDIMFYTLRDINALRRCRTFLAKPTTNAVQIVPEQLPYYCYIDCFKDYIDKVPYYLGNFDIPIDLEQFDRCRDAVVAVSQWKHPEVFGPHKRPSAKAFQTVKKLILSTIAKPF